MNDNINNLRLDNLDITEERKYLIRLLQNIYQNNLVIIQHYITLNNDIRQDIIELINNQPSRERRNNVYPPVLNLLGRRVNRIPYRRPPQQQQPQPQPQPQHPIRYTVSDDLATQFQNTSRMYSNGYNYWLINQPEESLIAEVDSPTSAWSTDIIRLLENIFQQNTILIPTAEQITNATQTMKYSDIENPRQTECSICFERFQPDDTVMIIRNCGHIFKPLHLNEWFTRNSTCPVCRYDIRSYSSTTNR